MPRLKAYYPKDQIIPGLYTNGQEWMLEEDDSEYIGSYHRYTDGNVVTLSEYIPNKSKFLVPYKFRSKSSIRYRQITKIKS